MEDRREEKPSMASPHSVIVTYYEGDINTVVDEHFFRALSKNSSPKDLSVKPRDTHTPLYTDSQTPPSWSTSCSRSSVCSPNHTRNAAPQFPVEETLRSSSVIVNRPHIPASWSLPQNHMLTPLTQRPPAAPPFPPPE